MSRSRVIAFVLVALVAAIGSVSWFLRDLERYRDMAASAPPVAQTGGEHLPTVPRIVFRNTAIGQDYGLVSMVPLADPSGPRTVTDLSCERIDVVARAGSCLQAHRGIVTRYRWLDLGPDLRVTGEVPLVGLPSRTRLSPDGSLVASTVFVAGHSYVQAGFATATRIRAVGGDDDYGNLERFTLEIGDEVVEPVDRNIWGVTFADDDTFYATLATGGTSYLVRGDLAVRRLTAIQADVECPALSPDGTRIAFKKDVGRGRPHWSIAVLDLASGEKTVLDGEAASVDDQLQWLDDDTVLYGLPRPAEPGVTDVWSLDVAVGSRPQLVVEQAWSPAVVR